MRYAIAFLLLCSPAYADLDVGQLLPDHCYTWDLGQVCTIRWDLDGEAYYLGDRQFQFRNGDMALEFTFTPPIETGFSFDTQLRTGEEYFMYGVNPDFGGSIEFIQGLDEPGPVSVNQLHELEFLSIDWVTPEDMDAAESAVMTVNVAADVAAIPEPPQWHYALLVGALVALWYRRDWLVVMYVWLFGPFDDE